MLVIFKYTLVMVGRYHPGNIHIIPSVCYGCMLQSKLMSLMQLQWDGSVPLVVQVMVCTDYYRYTILPDHKVIFSKMGWSYYVIRSIMFCVPLKWNLPLLRVKYKLKHGPKSDISTVYNVRWGLAEMMWENWHYQQCKYLACGKGANASTDL